MFIERYLDTGGVFMYTDKHPKAIHLQRKLQYIAKQLRNNPTVAETALWNYIHHQKIDGYKFRRQYPLYTFIVDFYCHTLKLIVEVDGGIHDNHRARDGERDHFLSMRGYTTLRFTNDEVLYDIEKVIEKIRYYTCPPSFKGKGLGEG